MKTLAEITILAAAFTLTLGAAGSAEVSGAAPGLVVSAQPLADEAGMSVLRNGGNAVDAAVAVGYALAVCHPAAGNIGGGGFAVIHTADGRNYALDFRETAPGASKFDMFLDKKGNIIPGETTETYRSAAVPGTVAGLNAMHERFGTMKLADLIAPAVKMAEEGIAVPDSVSLSMASHVNKLKRFPSSAAYFLGDDGLPPSPGELFIQTDLAATLKRIAAEGNAGFYDGETAALIEADMAENGGLITRDDLARYEAKWREPIASTYRGFDIISMCPPSSGGIIVAEILNIIENADMAALGLRTPAALNVTAEAMRLAFADRSEYLGDPDFTHIPAELTSKEYAKELYGTIVRGRAAPSSSVKPGGTQLREGSNTTHYSVIDGEGNAVSVTYTINELYGSGASVKGAGFLLNNEMDDFAAKPGVPNIYGLTGGDANAVRAHKRPLSSMSPTIVLKDGRIFMVLGSRGGSRIITTVAQVISNVIDYGMSIEDAVKAPRFHMQWLPDELRAEYGNGLSHSDIDALTRMGYTISLKTYMGDVNAIYVDPATGTLSGAHDFRSEY